MELHIGALVSLAGGIVSGIVISYTDKEVTIRTESGKKVTALRRFIESIQESAA